MGPDLRVGWTWEARIKRIFSLELVFDLAIVDDMAQGEGYSI